MYSNHIRSLYVEFQRRNYLRKCRLISINCFHFTQKYSQRGQIPIERSLQYSLTLSPLHLAHLIYKLFTRKRDKPYCVFSWRDESKIKRCRREMVLFQHCVRVSVAGGNKHLIIRLVPPEIVVILTHYRSSCPLIRPP